MKTKWKDINPAFLSLLFVLIIELINSNGLISEKQKGNFEIISNLILLLIAAYGFLFIGFPQKSKTDGALLRFFGNAFVVVSAFILNIDVFKNVILQIYDIFTGWHILWLFWSILLILTLIFPEACKMVYQWSGKVFFNIHNRSEQCFQWLENTIKNSHKGTLFSSAVGIILTFFTFIYEYKSIGLSLEHSSANTIIICILWMIFCMLFALYGSILPKIGKAVNEINYINILKYLTAFITISIILFTVYLILPFIFGIFGMIMFIFICIVFIIVAIIHSGKKIFQYIPPTRINWHDICFLSVILLLVTFIIIPCVGIFTETGTRILASQSQKYLLSLFPELFSAGLNMLKELIFRS